MLLRSGRFDFLSPTGSQRQVSIIGVIPQSLEAGCELTPRPAKLPQLGQALGGSIRSFKKGLKEEDAVRIDQK